MKKIKVDTGCLENLSVNGNKISAEDLLKTLIESGNLFVESDVNEDIKLRLTELTSIIYQANVSAGWHNNLDGSERTQEEQEAMFPTRIALCHSELSEALEGWRKDLMDDHLPNRRMPEVELADTVIRIFDLAGAMKYDLAGAIMEKLEYNKIRQDHKLENRNKKNGKKI